VGSDNFEIPGSMLTHRPGMTMCGGTTMSGREADVGPDDHAGQHDGAK
jgi:hypothetical protein